MRGVCLVAAVAAFAVAVPLANAATWGVSNTTDTPVGQACPGFTGCSLREAITSTEANPGPDAILVAGGTYPLTNGQLTVTQDLTVSRVGAAAATISGSNASRIFDITGIGTDFVVRFLTLTHGAVTAAGSAAQGGAIRGASGTTISLETSTISSSSVSTSAADAKGGGIYSDGAVTIGTASGSITGSVVTGNTATTDGSGTTANGGGVAVSGGSLTIGARTIISSNTVGGSNGADARGAGVWFDSLGLQATFSSAAVTGNTASGSAARGGGVDVQRGAASFTRSTLSGNTATTTGNGVTGGGGGISSAASIQLSFSTLAGNTADATGTGSTADGGGIGLFGSETAVNVGSSTISSNVVSAGAGSTAAGAGVFGTSGQPGTLSASILAGNTGSGGSQCQGFALTSGGYDVLGPLGACVYTAGAGDAIGVTDPLLKVLGNYGGLTETVMPALGSPALNVVPSADALCTASTTDQRGVSRPQGGNCDVGAVEARPGTLTITPDPRNFADATLSTPTTANVALSNSGDLDVPAPSLNFIGPFSSTGGCTSTVAAGTNCILGLQFAPTAGGRYDGRLGVRSGAVRDTATLTGIGWAPTVAPGIPGTPSVGFKTSLNTGRWPANVSSFTVQWQRCAADGTSCGDILGARIVVRPAITGSTRTVYTPVLADAGHTLRVRLTAKSTTGVDSDPVTTAPSAVVTRTTPTLVQTPVVERSSSPVVGTTLSANHGQWTGAPDSYTYQWIRCDADGTSNCADISGKTTNRYKPVAGDVGHTLRVRVRATNPAGTSAPATSAPSGVVS